MERWNEVKKDQNEIPSDKQMVLLGSIWTPVIDAFVKKHAPDPVICIGAKSEAAMYGGLKMVRKKIQN